MSQQLQTDYAALMEDTWALLNSSEAGAQALRRRLPDDRRELLAPVSGRALFLEQVRRRVTLATVLLETLPVTYFAFAALEGGDGVMKFLESEAFNARPDQPGSSFPPAGPASAALIRYVQETGWIDRRQGWIGEALAFERTHLFGAPTPKPRAVDGCTARLAPGSWVAHASFDVPLAGKILLQFATKYPWHDSLFMFKPKPTPLAVVAAAGGDKIRRFRLAGELALELGWLWDPQSHPSTGTLDHRALRKLVDAGVVEVTPDGP